ncbi:hypothetical protein F5890DRAFT_1534213 [Lentinula detonsa]|uniref:Uncharacterized protein n=1 Tax=Lentinula detonsa TaxID=2804962 RepID=A0AA38PU35_9AGAR|nr:hypothetical protein F5890DRAFT_1534213 [Lentinula detonsa]
MGSTTREPGGGAVEGCRIWFYKSLLNPSELFCALDNSSAQVSIYETFAGRIYREHFIFSTLCISKLLFTKLLSTPHLCDAMLPRLSSHRIVCACLFLVTSLLVTVVAGPLIAKPDQWERRTSATSSELYTRTIQVIRIGFQKPGSETYENIKEISRSSYDGLRLTMFFGSTGFQPRIITHKDTNTTELDSKIKIVEAPRRPASAGKEIGNVNYNRMMDIGPGSKSLRCDFFAEPPQTEAVEIMSNVERLKAETNELLQTWAGVKADGKYTQVHDIEDDLDYIIINTCLLFLTLFRNAVGNPMVKSEELNVWHNLYSRLNRERGVPKDAVVYEGKNT